MEAETIENGVFRQKIIIERNYMYSLKKKTSPDIMI